jgi:hypothetical protein
MSVFLDRPCCRLRVFERVVLDWRRVCEIFVCVVMRYHVLPWSLSFLCKVEDLGSILWCVGINRRGVVNERVIQDKE